MVSAHDAHDDWYEDDEPYGGTDAGRSGDQASWPLSLVQPVGQEFDLVRPEDFGAAQRIADRLRDGASVLVDLGECDRALADRLTDFVSGLAYALDAALQHVGADVILLTPCHLRVSGDELSDIRRPGFHNRI